MTYMKVLFVCNQNKHRSKTAENIFSQFETRSAGLYNAKPVTKKELLWADVIFVMEDHQRNELAKRFPKEYMQKRIISLEIPDVYSYGQPALVKILRLKVRKAIRQIAA